MGIAAVAVGHQTSLLIVQSVVSRHAGRYTCTATNPGGATKRSAELVVRGTLTIPPTLGNSPFISV